MPRPAQAGRAAAGRAVRAWRASRTQQDIAAKAGINVDTLSDLESGSKWPRNRTLRAVEEALGREAGELDRIAWEGDHPPDTGRPPSVIDEKLGEKAGDFREAMHRLYGQDAGRQIRLVEEALSQPPAEDDGAQREPGARRAPR